MKLALTISILYTLTLLFFSYYTGLIPFIYKGTQRFECPWSDNTVFLIEVAIFSISLYLNLTFGIANYSGDCAYFVSVITRLSNESHPFAGLYANSDIIYPPLFYFLYFPITKFITVFHIPVSYTSRAFILCMKFPAIICEFAMAYMLYRTAKHTLKKGQGIPILLLTLLNPAFLFVTAFISQIDAIYVCFVFLTVRLLCQHRLKCAYFAFAAGIMFKFQTIFVTPVVFYAIIHDVFLHDFNWKKFRSNLLCGLSAIFCMFLCYLPFVWDHTSHKMYEGGITANFVNSIQSYGLASQNTYNLWTLLGYNFLSQELPFGPLPCHTWGTIFIILFVTLSAVAFCMYREDTTRLPLLAALLVSGTVCFATKMMPRYLYPAVVLLIFAYVIRPTVKRFLCAVNFTICFFLLTFSDYVIYPQWEYTAELIWPRIVSVYFIFCVGMLTYVTFIEPLDAAADRSCTCS